MVAPRLTRAEDALFRKAVALRRQVRLQLAELLYATLDPDWIRRLEQEAFCAACLESHRRLRASERGELKAIPVKEVFRNIRARLKSKKRTTKP